MHDDEVQENEEFIGLGEFQENEKEKEIHRRRRNFVKKKKKPHHTKGKINKFKYEDDIED